MANRIVALTMATTVLTSACSHAPEVNSKDITVCSEGVSNAKQTVDLAKPSKVAMIASGTATPDTAHPPPRSVDVVALLDGDECKRIGTFAPNPNSMTEASCDAQKLEPGIHAFEVRLDLDNVKNQASKVCVTYTI